MVGSDTYKSCYIRENGGNSEDFGCCINPEALQYHIPRHECKRMKMSDAKLMMMSTFCTLFFLRMIIKKQQTKSKNNSMMILLFSIK